MSEVKVYSTPNCPYCSMTKDFLKERKIPFADINVAEDQNQAREMIEKSGQQGVPVTDVDGQIIIGFDKEALKKALHLKE